MYIWALSLKRLVGSPQNLKYVPMGHQISNFINFSVKKISPQILTASTNFDTIGTLWVISQEPSDEIVLYLAYARIYIRGTCRPNMMLIESIIDY